MPLPPAADDLIEVGVDDRALDLDVEDARAAGGRAGERVGEVEIDDILAVRHVEAVEQLGRRGFVAVLALEEIFGLLVAAAEDRIDAGDHAGLATAVEIADVALGRTTL